ncbi:unnamed protein product [Scytosiphon promiscuus]
MHIWGTSYTLRRPKALFALLPRPRRNIDSHSQQAKRARTSSSAVTLHSRGNAAEMMSTEEEKRSHPRRWDKDEDERLRASVEKHHGTNWKHIAAEVRTRNHVQCLQRYRKVLAPGLVKGQWTPQEDQLLLSVVNEGHKNWGSLSKEIPGRTSKQCRERWMHHLDPSLRHGAWTPAEDRIIVSLQRQIGSKWAQIAQHLDGRTENATKIRWKILEREMKKEEEGDKEKLSQRRHKPDARLRCLAAQAAASVLSKTQKASLVGVPKNPMAVQNDFKRGPGEPLQLSRVEKVEPRPASITEQVRERQPISSNDNKGKKPERCTRRPSSTAGGASDGHSGRRGWLAEEDERLKEAIKNLGDSNWRGVAQSVRTRNALQCQQRWNKALRPGLVKGAWSVEEDDKLVRLIEQGFSSWSALAANTGRTAKQCRERWMHHLDPSLRHQSWTPEEDQALLALEARLGTKWAAIAREIPGRTEHAVKGRSKTLAREMRRGRASSSPECSRPPPPDRKRAAFTNGIAECDTPPRTHPPRPRLPSKSRREALTLPSRTETAASTTRGSQSILPLNGSASDAKRGEGGAAGVERQGQSVRLPPPAGPAGRGKGGDGPSIASSVNIKSSPQNPDDTPHSGNANVPQSAQLRAEERPHLLAEDPCILSEPNPDFNGEVSSLPNKIDYSDLASILMDGGFDALKDGVEPESEAVTLGEDPYSDYSLAADTQMFVGPYHSTIFDDQPLEDIMGSPSPSALPEAVSAPLFDSGNAEDPYYYF